MARTSRLKRAYLKQKRYAVAELKLKEMSREGHLRAQSVLKENQLRVHGELIELSDDVTVNQDRLVRLLQGLEEGGKITPREHLQRQVCLLADRAELIFKVRQIRMFLIREDDGWYYFLYRDKGRYYKKSMSYPSRTRAMERYDADRITWRPEIKDSHG